MICSHFRAQFAGYRYPSPRCELVTLAPVGVVRVSHQMQASSVFSFAMTCHPLPLLASVCHRRRQSPQAMRASNSNGYQFRLAVVGWLPLVPPSLVAARFAIRWLGLPHRVLVAGFGMLKNIGAMAFFFAWRLVFPPCTLGIAHKGKAARKKTNFFLCYFIQWFSGWLL